MMYQVEYVDMPTSIRSFVRESPDGYMTIVINPRLSYYMQRLACRHEIAHIERGDLDDARDADEIETEIKKTPALREARVYQKERR